mgnify:CR=1 FL=1
MTTGSLGPDPDSQPPAGVHSLWRLRGYLRPHKVALTIMLTTSLVGVGLTLAIPLVTAAIIDGPVADRDLSGLWALGALAMVLGVALFRLFDIWKPWPIRVLDAKVHGGLGIMIDDVLAGFYAFLVVQLLFVLL